MHDPLFSCIPASLQCMGGMLQIDRYLSTLRGSQQEVYCKCHQQRARNRESLRKKAIAVMCCLSC